MSTPIRQTGAQHVHSELHQTLSARLQLKSAAPRLAVSINASPSPTSSRTMSSAAGLHERRPSDNPATAASHSLFEDPASINGSGVGGSALASTARWAQRFKGLVQNAGGGGQSWWSTRKSRGLTSTPSRFSGRRDSLHTGATPFSPLRFLGNALSIFYITEEQQSHLSRLHHPHSDSDSLPSSSSSLAASIPLPNTPAHTFPSPSPLLTSTTRIPSSYYNPGKRPVALSRTGWLAITLLFLLGLRELVFLSRIGGRGVPRAGKGSIRVKGRDPWAVLRDYEGVKPKKSGLPGWDTMWKLPLVGSSSSPTTAGLGAGSGLMEANWGMEGSLGAGAGDTTAIVLHWKRTDNVRVIVAKLCQYEFFDSVFVWNNNPEIRLTREVSSARLSFTPLCSLTSPLHSFSYLILPLPHTPPSNRAALPQHFLPPLPPPNLQLAAQPPLHRALPRLPPIPHPLLFLARRRLDRPPSPGFVLPISTRSRGTGRGAYE